MKATCSDISIYDYIRCRFHGEYYRLLDEEKYIEGNEAQRSLLSDTWDKICEEWVSITGNQRYFSAISDLDKANMLACKLLQIQSCLDAFVVYQRYGALIPYPDFALKGLRDHRLSVKFPADNPDGWEGDYKKVVAEIKALTVAIDVINDKLKKGAEGAQEVAPQTEQNFTDDLVYISKFMGFQIKTKETTMAEYAGYIRANNIQAERERATNGTRS